MEEFNRYRLLPTKKGVPSEPAQKRQCTRMFIQGPIYLDWLAVALQLPGKAPLATALAIWFQSGLEKSPEFRFTPKLRKRFGLTQRTARRALGRLETAGLIRVTRKPGSCNIVTVLPPPQI